MLSFSFDSFLLNFINNDNNNLQDVILKLQRHKNGTVSVTKGFRMPKHCV